MKKYIALFILIFTFGLLAGGPYENNQKFQATHKYFLGSYNAGSENDPRVIRLKRYLQANNSRLSGYEENIVRSSVRYGISPSLIVAISKAESSLCLNDFGSNNCWGIGGTNNFQTFGSLSEGIEYVARLLGTSGYYKTYRETGDLEILANVYCGPACKGWASVVRETMEKI